jgi:3-hydroxyacyl-CoA dehydrogenase/enoyl-CoA hydratase/3-hydroxybutyryl-CoA epimerase
MDEIGIDVGAHVTSGELRKFFDKRGAEASHALSKLADAGFKGRKNMKGFLQYDEKTGKKIRGKVNSEVYEIVGVKENSQLSKEIIKDRLISIMINEAALCLEETILSSPLDGDIGAIFGLGFPPFLGGPFRHLDTIGADVFKNQMNELKSQFGDRFTVAGIITDKAANQDTFYPVN